MKLQILAAPLLVALMLSPAFAAAATGTLTFTSPTAGSSLNGVAAYTIAGTISPVPPAGTDNVNIQVTNPSSQLVDVQTVAVSATGAFSYTTNAGGNSAWTSGTYKISASDSNGAANTLTFTYLGNPTPGTGSPIINIFVAAATPVFAGQASPVDIEAMLVWSTNGTLVSSSATTTATLWAPNGVSSSLGSPLASSTKGQDYWTYTVPAGSPDGAYFIQVVSKYSGEFGWGLGSFTVNSQIGSASGLSAIASSIAGVGKNVTALSSSLSSDVSSINSAVASVNSAVGSLNSQLGTISTNVGTIGTAVSGLTASVGTISTTVGNIQTSLTTLSSTVSTLSNSVSSISSSIQTLTTDVTGLQTSVGTLAGLSAQMTTLQGTVSSLSSSVSSEQTYILVVALIAAVTLVLELAILIRKLS